MLSHKTQWFRQPFLRKVWCMRISYSAVFSINGQANH
jgi:hypothetical protein